MAHNNNYYNCGCINLGGWTRDEYTSEADLKTAEIEIKELVQHAEQGWTKIIIATVLKKQDKIRKLLRKYGFKKTPEALSKYDPKNTQCIYYFDSNCIKKKGVKAK